MLDTLKLDIAVGLLTRPSKHRLTDDTGQHRWVTADPLLVQLAVAVGNSSAAAKFKASAGSPLPISADAHDLLERIMIEAAEHWWHTHALHKGEGRGTLGGQIRAWAMVARTSEQLLADAERIICGWAAEIQQLFEPVRRWEIRGSCPKCKTSRVLDRQDEDGHRIMKPALCVYYDAYGELDGATCASCGEVWERGIAVETLARMVASQGSGDAA